MDILMTMLVLCFLIGVIAGLRAITAPAVVCWGAHLGWLHLEGTKLAFLGHPITLVIITLMAIGEIINDKLPKTPARTSAGGLIPRILFGGFSGAAVAISVGEGVVVGAILGIVGALVGTYAGYHIRHAIVTKANLPDLPVALLEDVIAIAGGLLIISRV
jgi:uncharacterized membrane protein